MTLPTLSACAIIGMLPLLFLSALPSGGYLITAVVVGLIAGKWIRPVRYIAAVGAFFVWGLFCAHQAVKPAWEWTSGHQQVEVRINATDGEQIHEASIIRRDKQLLPGAVPVTLYGRIAQGNICSGQRWNMVLVLRPVHGQLNEGGFDKQRYALSQGRVLTGRIINATPLDTRCGLRGRYIASVTAAIAHFPWRDVLLALGFGERLAVSDEIKTLMRNTGTAHLMAISGLHIALAGSVGWGIARLLQYLLPVFRVSYRFPIVMGLMMALLYTWLAGAQPPALRTLVSLTIWATIRLSGRQWHPWQVWLCCIAGILVVDPLAVLSESLWLSGLAVAALIFWYQWLPYRPRTSHRGLQLLCGMAHLQLGVTLLLMPLQVLLFHGISLTSVVANLFAVPAVTFISVPLILAGMGMHLLPFTGVEQGLWWLADGSLAVIFYLLRLLPTGWVDADSRYMWLSLIGWMSLIIWRLRMWCVMPGTVLAVFSLCAFPFLRKPDESRWAVHMLDIGHGLSVVIERNGRALVYDSGNAWPGGDSATQTLIPWLRWHGLTPDGVIISHEHLDHRGGLDALQTRFPGLPVRSPLGWDNHLPCERGQRWRWQGLTFSVHWPLAGHHLSGNNRSCVVKVTDGKRAILLTGDIEADAELAMLKHHWQQLHADVIQVPHHGSRTSSGVELLNRVGGNIALASVARYNAWRLPSAVVTSRYRDRGYAWYDTAHAGQISLIFQAQSVELLRYREQILPRWYHQWFGVPTDSR